MIGNLSATVSATDRKVVLVTRRTRLEELVARHHTLAQAKFYVEHLGADFGDYLAENSAYAEALALTVRALQACGRYQLVDRSYLLNFMFAPDDIVVALGQDGLVANTMKYLQGQPLIGLNPEPARWEGLLLPFKPIDLRAVLDDVTRGKRPIQSVTMAEAVMSDGQTMRAVNDLFIGPRTHTSASYELSVNGHAEKQSSSGVIVSTGLGSTAWLKSIVTGSQSISMARQHSKQPPSLYESLAWNAEQLVYAVREPFPAKGCGTALVYGQFGREEPLRMRSLMPEHGVIFSDGIEADFLRFTAGLEVRIGIADVAGQVVT